MVPDTAGPRRFDFGPATRDLLAELDSGEIRSFENGAGVVGPDGVVLSDKAVPLRSRYR